MLQSETIGKLAEALAKAQGQMAGAAKESNNPYFNSKYADLAAVWEACREPLSANGLAVIQTTEPMEGGVSVITTLAHTSGEWIRGQLVMKSTKQTPQEVGSCISYARRYALAAMVGIYQVDDDAQRAMDRRPKINKAQAAKLGDLLTDTGSDLKEFLSWIGTVSLYDIPAEDFDRAKRALETKAKRNGKSETASA